MSWVNEQTASYEIQPQDNGKLIVFNSGSAVTATLLQPTASAIGVGGTFVCHLANINSGVVTVSPVSCTIDGQPSITVDQFQGVQVWTDGTNYFSVRGLGSSGSGLPTATAAYQAPLSTGAGTTYAAQQIIPFDATYTLWVSSGTVYARNEATGAVQFSGTDAAVVINDVLSAISSAGGTLYFKQGTYNFNSATQETVSPYSLYYCVGIPAGSATNYPEFRFVGENTANGSQSNPETAGVIFNVTTAAETAAGSGNTLVAFWARPNTNHDSDYPNPLYWNGHLLFENLGITFQANTRGNEHAINALESGYLECNNVQAGFVTAPTALAATNLKAFVSPGTPSDGVYMRNVYAMPGWGTGFEINTDHSILIDTVAYQATTGYAIGIEESRNASVIYHSGQWIHPQVFQCVNGITAGSYLASATQIDIFGLDLEYVTTGAWAYSTGFTTGNLGGFLSWSNVESNVGRGTLTTPFPSGSGGNYLVESNGLLTGPAQSANEFLAGPSSGSAASPTFRAIVPADLPVATYSSLGAVQPDGATVTVNGSGVISASVGAPAPLFNNGAPNVPVTPAVVQTLVVAATSTGSVSGAFASSVTAGNVIVVLYFDFGSSSPPSISDSFGSSFTAYNVGGYAGSVYVAQARSTGTETISLTGTDEYGVFVCYEVSGASTVIDNALQKSSSSSTPSLGQTTSVANDIQFSYISTGGCTALSGVTVTSGWNLSALADHLGSYCAQAQAAYNVAGSAGSQTVSWSAGQAVIAQLLSLRANSSVLGTQGQLYFDVSTSPYTAWVYNASAWHEVS